MGDKVKIVYEGHKYILSGPDCWEIVRYIREMLDNSTVKYKVYYKKEHGILWHLMYTISML